MKYQNMKIVTKEALLQHVLARVEKNHKPTKAGGKRGGIRVTAKEYAITEGSVSMYLNGSQGPHENILAEEGLQKFSGYVPVTKSQQNDE